MGDTTLIDIYEAAGATVSEDRKMVSMTHGDLKPFKIELLVYPGTVEFDGVGGEKITFDVMLEDEFALGKTTYAGTPMHQIHHIAEVTLPVSQVKIIKENA